MNKIEEFYKEAGCVEYDKFDKKAPKFTYYDMIGFADAYHSKQLNIGSVSKCADEVIKYIENDAEIAMPIEEMMNEDGSHLTKKKYGHVLLKHLVKELRQRFC